MLKSASQSIHRTKKSGWRNALTSYHLEPRFHMSPISNKLAQSGVPHCKILLMALFILNGVPSAKYDCSTFRSDQNILRRHLWIIFFFLARQIVSPLFTTKVAVRLQVLQAAVEFLVHGCCVWPDLIT